MAKQNSDKVFERLLNIFFAGLKFLAALVLPRNSFYRSSERWNSELDIASLGVLLVLIFLFIVGISWVIATLLGLV